MRRDLLERLIAAGPTRHALVLVTDLLTGQQTLVNAEGRQSGEAGLPQALLPEVLEALRRDRSGTVEVGDGQWFLAVHNPPRRLALIGAVHIAQALAPMAVLAGYDVTVIDPRAAFATPERFPAVTLSTEWPAEALTALAPDHRTAVIALTHDPKLDDPALVVALASPSFYVGALGSRRTQAARLERLAAMGVGGEALSRLHGPLGLDIGALTPAEIAISALAQMTQVLHRGAP